MLSLSFFLEHGSDTKRSSDLILRSGTCGVSLSISEMSGEGAASEIENDFCWIFLDAYVSICMKLLHN